MIEVNRRLYLDESTGKKLPTFAHTRTLAAEMITAAVGLLRSSSQG